MIRIKKNEIGGIIKKFSLLLIKLKFSRKIDIKFNYYLFDNH